MASDRSGRRRLARGPVWLRLAQRLPRPDFWPRRPWGLWSAALRRRWRVEEGRVAWH